MRNPFVVKALSTIYWMHRQRLSKGKPNILHSLLGNNLYFKLRCNLDILPAVSKYDRVSQKGSLKSITLVFNGEVYNGGLTDKLQAIASVYFWCKQNHIDFKVYFSSPFLLTDYLSPHSFNWNTDSDTLDYDGACPKALFSYRIYFGEKKNEALHRKSLDELMKCGKEKIHLYSNTSCYDEHYAECFNELFVPVQPLETELAVFQEQIGEPFVSISFRFTQLLGDLKDTFGTVLPLAERKALIQKCKESIAPILNENHVKKALVTSDSKTFLEEIAILPYVYIIPGSVGHVGNKCTEEQIRKTFWDMLMISRARKAYMVRTPQMYRSGFAKHAALIGNIPYEEVILP